MFYYTTERHIFDLISLQTFIFNQISNTVVTSTGTETSVTFGFSTELSEELQTSLTNLILNYTDHIEEDDGVSFISRINKRHHPMQNNETWEGSWEDIGRYATLTINCKTDKRGLLQLMFSNDAIDTQFCQNYNMKPNVSFVEIKTISFRYFKLKYINDFESQTDLCIHTMAHMYRSKGASDTTIPTEVTIKEESIPTGQNFRSESKPMIIPPNSVGVLTYLKKYRVSVLELRFSTEENQKDDVLNAYVAKNTVIGVIGSNAIIGDTSFYVSPTVIQYLQVGFVMSVTDGINTQELGDCEYISGNNVTFTNALEFDFAVGSIIKMSIQNIRNYVIGHAHTYVIGASKNGSSSIPPNTVLNLEYTNNSDVEKKLYFMYDYLY